MCANNDLRAQAGITSGDVMRVMGGVALASLGLFVIGVALAVGMANQEIEPFRAALTVGSVAAVMGTLAAVVQWSHMLLDKRLTEILASACTCPSGVNGVTIAEADGSITAIGRASR